MLQLTKDSFATFAFRLHNGHIVSIVPDCQDDSQVEIAISSTRRIGDWQLNTTICRNAIEILQCIHDASQLPILPE
jgi:hypothetical protein